MTTLGNYELEGLLGEGGIGQVYAAQDKVLGRHVAIKTLRAELSRDRSFVDRFYSEAKSLANLNHTNITTLYALQVEGSEAFMVMELVHGQTLQALLARVGRLTLRDSLAILAQAVPGIRYAHRRGVIHRDLKPANLMLTDDGVVKIMDFGIARVRGSEHLTQVGEFCGTFVYASPEQIRGEEVDERSDLYSLAIVFYRMLAGIPPFQSDNEYALMTAQLQTPPPPLTGRVPGLDTTTEAVLMRALAKRREDRYASVEEFGKALGAMALRGESMDILQQLYAQAFASGDPEATIIQARHAPVVEPTPPSSPAVRERDAAAWQLPAALAITGTTLPQLEARAAGRRSVLAEAPASTMSPQPVDRRGSARRWFAVTALVAPLLVAGGYFAVSPEVTWLPSFSQPSPSTAEVPPPPVPRTETPPTLPAATPAMEEPPPAPPPMSTVREEPPPAMPAKAEPPHSPPSVETVNEEPPPTLPPVMPAKEEPPLAPPPVQTVKEEPPPTPPSRTPAKEEPPPLPPAKAMKDGPPPAPPPVTPAAEEPPPVQNVKEVPPTPPPVKTAREEPPPAPAPVTPANDEPRSVHKAEPSPRTSPDRLASLEPERIPLEPEGKPDLQGHVTGAKRLDEIEVDGRWIKIYGIVDRARGSQEAQHVSALVRYLRPSHNHVVCYRKAADTYRCYSDGQDIARLALEDGMVHPAAQAPSEYRSLPNRRR